jgi:hypothetical protein
MEPIRVGEGSAARGIILHKIMEELLTGEVKMVADAVRKRSIRLVAELGLGPGLDANELAETALRTWSLPELASNREGCLPRCRFMDGLRVIANDS